MNDQRIAAVHRRGPNINSKIEFISMTKLKTDYQGHPAYYPVLCAPPGTPPPEIGQMVYSFDMGGASEDFFEICRQYLDILTKLLEEFEKQNP